MKKSYTRSLTRNNRRQKRAVAQNRNSREAPCAPFLKNLMNKESIFENSEMPTYISVGTRVRHPACAKSRIF